MNTSLIKYKVCCFIGHRKIEVTDELKEKVKEIIEDLIICHNVLTFLFGSRSEFDTLCHSIVSDLKGKYPNIKRIAYTCRSEGCNLESEREKWERIYSEIYKEEVHILSFEEEFEHKTKYTAGKASYIERNQAMINDSDFCVFYCDENYQPEIKYFKRSIGFSRPKSGTKLAYEYAKKKKKILINIQKLL